MLDQIHRVQAVFDPDQCFTALVTDGFYVSHDLDIARSVNLSDVEWRADEKSSAKFEYADGDDHLSEVFSRVEKHLELVWRKLERVNMWYCNGVDDTSSPWHTDLLEDINISVLCYLSDMTPDVQGYVAVRNTLTNRGTMLYPKFGNVLVLHHARGFEHRAEPTTVDRFYVNCTYRTTL